MIAAIGGFELLRPGWLAVALLLLPWLFVWRYRSLVHASPARQRFSLVLRAVQWSCLVLALAGLSWNYRTQERFVVVALDRSASVGRAGFDRANQWAVEMQQHAGHNRVAVMEFAGEPGRLQSSWSPAEVRDGGDVTHGEAMRTNLAKVIDQAAASVPSGYVSHLVMATDGIETEGDALSSAVNDGICISVVELPRDEQPQVQVSDVNLPADVRLGEPFDVEVTITANYEGSGRLSLFRNDLRVDVGTSNRVSFPAGETVLRLRQQVDEASAAVFTARIDADGDTLLDDNALSGITVATGQPRVLIVDSRPETIRPLRWALEEHEMEVDIRPIAGLPTSLTQLMTYDAVILSDVPATVMSSEQLENLRRYVERLGGGLVMLGSNQSFGLGGYYRTPLEAVLPVSSDLDQENERSSLAMVLVIDRSGSMGGDKIDLAKDAARAAVELLGPRDQIGVVAFDDEAHWIAELQPAASKQALYDRIDRLSPAGGTNLFPAMQMAREALLKTSAKYKHVIILSDGISTPADFQTETASMVDQRITVSTVAVGEKADRDRLSQIAQQGGGRYYECEDPRAVPQVFARETTLASKSAIDESPFFPQQVRTTSVLRGIDGAAMPLLFGHVVTRVKPTSETILVTEQGQPLLAWWRFGLGMALAFTSDAKDQWATEWLTWPDFSSFWAQCVRHVARRQQTRGGELQVLRRGQQLSVTLDLVDERDRFVNDAVTRLTLMGSQDANEGRVIPMSQVAPGRYATDLHLENVGSYFLDVSSEVDGQPRFQQFRGVYVGYPDELRLRPVNRPLLAQLARQTGGHFNPSPRDVLSTSQPDAARTIECWPWLVVIAACLLVLDVAARRLELRWKVRPRTEDKFLVASKE